MNSWVLFDLGAATEEAYGTSRYLVFYFISTITAFTRVICGIRLAIRSVHRLAFLDCWEL